MPAAPHARAPALLSQSKSMPGRLSKECLVSAAFAGILGLGLGCVLSANLPWNQHPPAHVLCPERLARPASAAATEQLSAWSDQEQPDTNADKGPGLKPHFPQTMTDPGEGCNKHGWRRYGTRYGPCDICGLGHGQVMDALGMDPRCNKDAFWDGRWQPMTSLPKMPKGKPICILLCAPHIPCHSPPCLLSMTVRPGSSDGLVVRDVFLEGVFNLGSRFRMDMPAGSAVLDAGANIGAASVYFSLLYPNSTVVSVEPSGPNYELLVKNTELFPRTFPVHLALWSRAQTLCLVHGQRSVKVLPEYAFQVLPCAQLDKRQEVLGKLQGVPVSLLLETFHLDRFDILKIDIEGGEGDVFRDQAELGFLQNAKLAVLELHDDMWKDASQVVSRAFKSIPGWADAGIHGEHQVWVSPH